MSVWKDGVRKDWRYKFQYLGEVYAAGGFSTKREASAAREERRKSVKERPKKTQTGMAFSVLANKYLDVAERTFVTDTYKRKKSVCKRFIECVGDLHITEIEPESVQTYLSTIKTNTGFNEHREELATVFNWIKKTYSKDLPFFINPCAAVGKVPVDEKEKQIPSEEELLRIIAAAKPGDEKDTVLCCVHLLGRIDEILRLRWKEDVNFEKRTVTLWTRKRRDGNYESNPMPMGDNLYEILMARWKARKQDKWVFFNPKGKQGAGDRFYHRQKMMAAICSRAGIAPIGTGSMKLWRGKQKGKQVDVPLYYGFHALRHFTASYLADKEKVSLKTVSGLLRHKNLRTTEIYLHQLDPSHREAVQRIDDFTSENAKRQAPGSKQKNTGSEISS